MFAFRTGNEHFRSDISFASPDVFVEKFVTEKSSVSERKWSWLTVHLKPESGKSF